jgi:hypothetical protein
MPARYADWLDNSYFLLVVFGKTTVRCCNRWNTIGFDETQLNIFPPIRVQGFQLNNLFLFLYLFMISPFRLYIQNFAQWPLKVKQKP